MDTNSGSVIKNSFVSQKNKSKTCSKCLLVLDISFFNTKKGGKYGKDSFCKTCRSTHHKNWVLNNREKYRQYHLKYKKENKERILEYAKMYHKKRIITPEQKERARWKDIETLYGINKEQYYTMFENQNGVCAICFKEENKTYKGNKYKRLNIDHCHKTGNVRGLLCRTCNQGLGMFYDNLEYLNSALLYLRKHEQS